MGTTTAVGIESRSGPRHVVRAIRERGLFGTVALVLSVVACYGTLAAVAALSALGVTLTLNTGVWAGAIVLFAALATAIVGLGNREYGSTMPLAPAVVGTALMVYVMFVRYDRLLEVVAFALLAAAVVWDYRLRARPRSDAARRTGAPSRETPAACD